MARIFIIEDEFHAEWQPGEYTSFAEAVAELERWATVPWGVRPNAAPCSNSSNCTREYVIIEFEAESKPWTEVRRMSAFDISAKGVEWRLERSGA